MNQNLARLRVMSAESGDLGSAAARDVSIQTFLNELGNVVCEQVIDLLPDSKLRSLYVSWTKQLGLDELSRRTWIAEGVIISPAAAGRVINPPTTENVFKLHARH